MSRSANVLLPEFANPVAQPGGALELLRINGAAQLMLQFLQLRQGPVLLDLGFEFAQGRQGPLPLELERLILKVLQGLNLAGSPRG